MEAQGAHTLFLRELRPGQTHLTHEPSRAVDRQTHEDHSLNRRQEPGHATSSHRLALSSRYCGSPGFGRLCRYPARFGSGPNHGATALDLPKALGRTWQSRSAKSIGRKPMNDPNNPRRSSPLKSEFQRPSIRPPAPRTRSAARSSFPTSSPTPATGPSAASPIFSAPSKTTATARRISARAR